MTHHIFGDGVMCRTKEFLEEDRGNNLTSTDDAFEINKPFCSELEYDIIRQYCAIRKIDCTERLMDLFKSSLLDVCQGDEVLSSECSK